MATRCVALCATLAALAAPAAAQATTDLGLSVQGAPVSESVILDSDMAEGTFISLGRTVVVTNTGDEPISDPAVRTNLTPAGSSFECNGGGCYVEQNGYVHPVLNGPLQPGQSFTLSWHTGRQAPAYPAGAQGVVTLDASYRVQYDQASNSYVPVKLDDPNATDDTESVSWSWRWRDAALKLSGPGAPSYQGPAGTDAVYRGVLRNTGPDAYRVPALLSLNGIRGMKVTAASIPGGACRTQGRSVQCRLASIAAGAKLPITVRARSTGREGNVEFVVGDASQPDDPGAAGPYPSDTPKGHELFFHVCTDGDVTGDGWPDWGCEFYFTDPGFTALPGQAWRTNGIQQFTPHARKVRVRGGEAEVRLRCFTPKGCRALTGSFRLGRLPARPLPLRAKRAGVYSLILPLTAEENDALRQAGKAGLPAVFTGPKGFAKWTLRFQR